ncbi:MAG TPA: deoxyguanosinetriphosphate triphosphohydrolase [Hyphomonadaceae bacterium]|nr:deoxyguanosinetriphosphate triphosphohydrolase [Hyphomonadaceae bacterium]
MRSLSRAAKASSVPDRYFPWAPPRAPFATDPLRSRGRLVAEPDSRTRSPFQRDRDRIVHSSAFRRLKQKTQVFVAHEGDHYRTRLTHSLEVAQIARAIARTLGLDDDLAEAVALSHDLGHPPFGHAGEKALDACMAPFGGFDHNAQALRLVTKLEARYPQFDGLNLSWETLEGMVKHNGPALAKGQTLADAPAALRDYAAAHDLDLHSYSGPEAQIAALADDIAYNNHDIDDGLRAGLFSLDEIMEAPLAGAVFREVLADFPVLDRDRLAFEAVRRLIGVWIDDVTAETQRRIAVIAPRSVEDVRAAGRALVAFSPAMGADIAGLRRFLFTRMYRHTLVNRMMSQAKRIVRDLFALFMAEPETLPTRWRARAIDVDETRKARVVCDYIAGMTDNFAIEEHRKLFNLEPFL